MQKLSIEDAAVKLGNEYSGTNWYYTTGVDTINSKIFLYVKTIPSIKLREYEGYEVLIKKMGPIVTK